MPTYARTPIAFERGEGAYLFDAEGRRYLDFGAGIAVNALGHAHPHLVAALTGQAAKLWHVSNLYEIPESARLARRLADHSFADRVFFCNSGAEAMEGAIKLARRYHYHAGHPERFRIITCEGSFHGRTLTTLSAAQNPKHIEGFGPITEGFDQVAFGNLNELRAAITPETGAILVEPIQGEGGVRKASLDYLRGLRAVCDEFDLLLLFDEVRGAGLIIGLHCVVPNGELVGKLMEQGLLTVPAAENVVRLLPPLIIEDAQVDEALGILERVCAGWAKAA